MEARTTNLRPGEYPSISRPWAVHLVMENTEGLKTLKCAPKKAEHLVVFMQKFGQATSNQSLVNCPYCLEERSGNE